MENITESATRLQKAVDSLELFVTDNKAVLNASNDDERISNLMADNDQLKDKQNEAKQRLDYLIKTVSSELNL